MLYVIYYLFASYTDSVIQNNVIKNATDEMQQMKYNRSNAPNSYEYFSMLGLQKAVICHSYSH